MALVQIAVYLAVNYTCLPSLECYVAMFTPDWTFIHMNADMRSQSRERAKQFLAFGTPKWSIRVSQQMDSEADNRFESNKAIEAVIQMVHSVVLLLIVQVFAVMKRCDTVCERND